jgi:hypothetical protein
MRDHLDRNRAPIFDSGSDAVLDGTDSAMTSVGEALEKALGELARKVGSYSGTFDLPSEHLFRLKWTYPSSGKLLRRMPRKSGHASISQLSR